LPEQKLRRLLECGVCRFTHGLKRNLRGPHAAEIGKTRQKRHTLFEAAQQHHDVFGSSRAGDSYRKGGSCSRQMNVRSAQTAFSKGGGIAKSERGKIRRAREGRFEELPGLGSIAEELGSRSKFGSSGERLRDSVERVGPSHLIEGERRLGDALEE